MNRIHLCAITVLVCAFGCVVSQKTSLKVSGTAGAGFTAAYHVGKSAGTISTVLKAGQRSTIVQTPGDSLATNIRKQDSQSHLTAEIFQGGKRVLRVEAPPGTQGVIIQPTDKGWQGEAY